MSNWPERAGGIVRLTNLAVFAKFYPFVLRCVFLFLYYCTRKLAPTMPLEYKMLNLQATEVVNALPPGFVLEGRSPN